MKLLIYCRVSTTDQNVDQMAKACKKWAKENGHEVAYTIKDEESGTIDLADRRKFIKIIRDEYNFEYDGVLTFALDRLSRNWDNVNIIERHFRENWERKKLISVKDDINLHSPTGRFQFRILMAVACLMPEDMKEKQVIGIERAKREGKYKGGKKGRTWAKPKSLPSNHEQEYT